MSINIKIKEKPDLKKMEISELINYMENDYNFKTSYSYEELKETADYLRELAVQWHPDAMYAYSTFYNNVYDMTSWHKSKDIFAWEKDINKNEWYGKAIFKYDTMNTSDPEILLRIATAFLNKVLGEDTDTEVGLKICEDMLNMSDDTIRIDITNTIQYKLCLELRKYYKSIAEELYYEENIEEIEERIDKYSMEKYKYYYEGDEEKADEAYEAYEIAENEYYESKYCYFKDLASGVAGQLANLCSKEEANISPELQCIQGARIFNSASSSRAAKWYRKSAEQGYAPAMCYYAKCLSKGIGGAEKNVTEAEMWLIKAIESGLNYALLWLGDFYLENRNTYSNAVEDALECYELAAECGVYDAYKKLYKCYSGETTYPFEKNEEKAARYLELSQYEKNLKLPYRIISAIHYGSDVDGLLNLHRLF